MVETILFYVFSVGAIASSAAVIVLRNPLMSALALIVDFFFFAGLYVLLSAHFMAVIQILVYGGAIMVLFMFIIMLLNLRDDELERTAFRFHHALAVFCFVGISAVALIGVGNIIDRDEVKTNRAAVSEVENPKIATPSKVPGLYVDLNEDALEAKYSEGIAALANGDASAIDAKYPRDKSRPVTVPPVLLGKSPRGQDLPEPPTFGTAETISVLLVNRFVIPFELTAILLLAAIIGAVIIAKKRL